VSTDRSHHAKRPQGFASKERIRVVEDGDQLPARAVTADAA
jgi:hypothetical protein